MALSYKKLFKLMIDRDIKKKDLKNLTGLSYGSIAKLEKLVFNLYSNYKDKIESVEWRKWVGNHQVI